MNRGTLLVVSGPSGAGKGTILKPLLEEGELFYSVSATTRERREHEIEGVNYFFMESEEFLQKVQRGHFLEHTQYSGHYYGTPVEPVLKSLREGKTVVLEIEVQGAKNVKKVFPDAVAVFVTPSSKEELRHRLLGRGTETPEQVESRMRIAELELSFMEDYEYVVLNDDLSTAIRCMRAIILAERCRRIDRETILKG